MAHSGTLSWRGSGCLTHCDLPYVRTIYGYPAQVIRISTWIRPTRWFRSVEGSTPATNGRNSAAITVDR